MSWDGFSDERVGEIFVRRGGAGAPLLLLHGFPETHLMWRDVAPRLADRFTVVCADLPGYGRSGAAPSGAKRAMAAALVAAMERLGFATFAVAGHDRGGRVAYRMALDHPARVRRVAVLDVVPTLEAWERADRRLALGFWPWSLLAQPAPLPERLVGAAPDAVVDAALGGWGTKAGAFPAEVRDAYVAALRDPSSVHAICDEYRAAASTDCDDDAADRGAGRRIGCPLLALWDASGSVGSWYPEGPLAIWRRWADAVEGRAVEGGHFFPEERPAEVAAVLAAFFR